MCAACDQKDALLEISAVPESLAYGGPSATLDDKILRRFRGDYPLRAYHESTGAWVVSRQHLAHTSETKKQKVVNAHHLGLAHAN